MLPDPRDQKIALLERQIAHLNAQLNELKTGMAVLERENRRRRTDVNQLAAQVNRKTS
jgi:regulator of replication initiation timing